MKTNCHILLQLLTVFFFITLSGVDSLGKAANKKENTSASLLRQYKARAGVSMWGSWVTVATHTGSVGFTITASPLGDTVIRCKVRYYNKDNKQVTEEWRDDVTITTGNSVAKVEVAFMGIPLGSVVEGTVTP